MGAALRKETIMAALVKKYAPKVIGLATIAGLFVAGGAAVNCR